MVSSSHGSTARTPATDMGSWGRMDSVGTREARPPCRMPGTVRAQPSYPEKDRVPGYLAALRLTLRPRLVPVCRQFVTNSLQRRCAASIEARFTRCETGTNGPPNKEVKVHVGRPLSASARPSQPRGGAG